MLSRQVRTAIRSAISFSFAIAPLAWSQAGILEEIIVTAEKRATSIQDTAIAVTAFTGTELDRALISKPLDMQFSVPNMLMSNGNFNSARVAIRGVGNQAVGASSDAGTGVHFNGVYLNAPRVFETEFFDTERVEVLRGPQGTVYGRNTTAGVINMITRTPEEEFGGDINIELGNYNNVRLKGALNLPLSENWAQRFAMFYNKRDGYVDNKFNGDEVDGRDMFALRSSTRWASDDTNAMLVVNYMEEDSDRMRGSNQQCLRDPEPKIGCLPTGLANERTNGGATVNGFLIGSVVSPILGLDFPADAYLNSEISSDPREQYLDFTPAYELEDLMVSFEINHDFGDLTFTSLTGYHNSDLDARNDYDFAVSSEPWPVQVTVERGPDGPITVDRNYLTDRSTATPEQWSQEFRIASNYEGDWNFLLGGFWLTYTGETHYYIYSSSLTLYGETLGIDPRTHAFDNDSQQYELDTWAMFGELYWQTTESISMTFGLRYTDEEKTDQQRTLYLNFLDNPDDGYEGFSGDWQEPTGKYNISWDANDDVMTYLTLSRSYKSGGFNPVSTESPLLDPALGGDPNLANFDPEFINAIEIGAKTRLLNDSMQANITYFYYDYEGLQVSKITNNTSVNQNFDAAIQGFEGEFLWAPSQNWLLTANIAWLDTKMDGGENIDPADINGRGTTEGIVNAVNNNLYFGADCPDGIIPCPGLPAQLKGNQLPESPEFSVNLGVTYRWALDNGMEMKASTNYYWQDTFYSRVFNTVNDEVPSWDIWNATLTLYSENDSWFAELWGRNLNNDDHITGQFLGDQPVGLTTNQFLLEPRTYGVTFGYTF
ncbi:MAG: TonB-dependent receptor [Halioglobus sp.]